MYPYCTVTILAPSSVITTNESTTYTLHEVLTRDIVQSIKAMLLSHLETSYYTNYSFATEDDEIISDYVEIITLIPIPTSTESQDLDLKLTLKIKPAKYNEKLAREQIVRVREIIDNCTHMRSFFRPVANSPEKGPEIPVVDATKELSLEFPRNIAIGDFVHNTLLVFDDNVDKENGEHASVLSDIIKNVSYSGYNPIPTDRAAMGDVLYIEVITASDGVFYISCTCNGFYVNKSTRHHFDAAPQSNACFAHELLTTILLHNVKAKEAWTSLAVKPTCVQSPINVIITQYKEGKLNKSLDNLSPKWLKIIAEDKSTHSYNTARALEAFADNFGVDERGPLRDWNEEVQALRVMDANTDSLLRAKLIHKLHVEFYDASKRAVLAIVDGGHLSPMNPTDPVHLHVYVYNNLFISRSADSPDTFKVCKGEDAVRKATGHDSNNLAAVDALDIPGLCIVKSCVFDYKGGRFIVQSMLPGILPANPALQGARLMLGALDTGCRLKSKAPAYELMRQVAEKLGIAERTISAQPLPSTSAGASPAPDVSLEEPAGDISEAEMAIREHRLALASSSTAVDEADSPQSVVMDDNDELVELDSPFMPVCGPIETKLLKGTDGRLYMLESARLTPRDANYVSAADGGTGRIADEFLNVPKVVELASTYLLRRELIRSYAARKSEAAHKKLLAEAVAVLQSRQDGKEKVIVNESSATTESSTPEPEVTPEVAAAVEQPTALETAQPALEKPVISEADLMAVYQDMCRDPANHELLATPTVPLNVNSFLSFAADTNPETVSNDEKNIREISEYLFDAILPAVVENVRGGSILPMDGAQLTRTLHSYGVNLRYMGQLAKLSIAEEKIDLDMVSSGSRRVRGMPFFWLEMLETEMISRAFKVLLNRYMLDNEDVRSSPAKTIASMINAILGVNSDASGEDPKSKAKGKKSKAVDGSHAVPSAPDAVSSVPQFLEDLTKVVEIRFNYTVALLTGGSRTLSAPSLLRRICSVCGIQMVHRAYKFTADAGSDVPISQPITSSDIICVSPVLKGEPLSVAQPVREITRIIDSAKGLLRVNNVEESFAMAQEASRWCQQVLSVVHKDSSQAYEVLVNILLKVGDWDAVVSLGEKNISLLMQAGGLDDPELVPVHFIVAVAKTQKGDYTGAMKHLECARYIVCLAGGPNHPEIVSVLVQQAAIHKVQGNTKGALAKLVEAQQKLLTGGSVDQGVFSNILCDLAEVFAADGDLQRATELQTNSYRIAKQLYNPHDEACVSKKDALEKYIRLNAAEKLKPVGVKEINNVVHNYDELKEVKKDKKKSGKKGKK